MLKNIPQPKGLTTQTERLGLQRVMCVPLSLARMLERPIASRESYKVQCSVSDARLNRRSPSKA